jgi:hypothetical protein
MKGIHMATTVQDSKSGTTAGAKSYPIYVAGKWQTSQEPLAVRNPFSGDVIGVTYQASRWPPALKSAATKLRR